jgi:YecR-like lipoprotein
MKTYIWSVWAIILFVSGCTVQKELVPTGGSRADATVKLSYEYGMFQRPQVNAAQGESAAQARCAAWGYTGAEPFGGAVTKCESENGYGDCLRTLVTVTYQCTGIPPASQ